MILQLLTLALLQALTSIHYLPATFLAVEAAILHNFVWHERWTWKERTSAGLAFSVTQRFFRFHLASGLISIPGNLLIMRLFVGVLHFPFILANLIAIAGCSFSNFIANSSFVFRKSPPVLTLLAIIILTPGLTKSAGAGVELKPETIQAFQRYVELSENQMQRRLDGTEPFLRLEKNPDAIPQIRAGALRVEKSQHVPDVPHGMIQEWTGSMFIPDVTLEETVKLLQDYDNHKKFYPEVLDSKLLTHEGNELRAYLKLKKKEVLTVVLNTEYEVRLIQLGGNRCHIRSHSVRIAEVSDPGKNNEKELPPGQDRGFLWRLNSYWWLEQTKDGVFAELQTISLSRNVPIGVAWIVHPIVDKVPREAMKSTFECTRNAVRRESPVLPALSARQ